MELDGFQFHGDQPTFEDDRERDAGALPHGWATLRMTWSRMMETPQTEADRLSKILEQRG